MSDDQTAASMRFMPEVRRRIGDRGTTFRNSFTNWPLCCPSRATFMTGQYATNHRVSGNNPPDGGYEKYRQLHLNDNIATWVGDENYYVGHVGKYLNGYPLDAFPVEVPPGYDEWYANAGKGQSVYDYPLNENGELVEYGTRVGDFKGDVLTDFAVDFIDRRAPRRKPFFLTVAYTAPHGGGPDPSPQPPFDCQGTAKPAPRHGDGFDGEPLPEPPNLNEQNVTDKPAAIQNLDLFTEEEIDDLERKYRCRIESLQHVDDGVRKMLNALGRAGELDNTLVIYTADNGFFQGEHRIRPGKNRAYEEAVRVPLLMRGPGVPRDINVNGLVINPDTTATIVDIANATAGNELDGRSLLSVAKDPSLLAGRELLIEKGAASDEEPDDETDFFGIRTGGFKYVEHATGEVELYALRDDPYELRSLHDDPAYDAKEADLAARLEVLKTCSGESCW